MNSAVILKKDLTANLSRKKFLKTKIRHSGNEATDFPIMKYLE